MPAKRKPINEVKITTVTVKLSKSEKEHLVKLSKAENLTNSEVVRRLLFIADSEVVRRLLFIAEKMIKSEGLVLKEMTKFETMYNMEAGNVEEQPVRG